MAVHNDQRYVQEAIRSIQQQSYGNFELIVVDDGSSDASPRLLNQCATADARIRVVTSEHRGLTRSLNRGVELARGEVIARMDSDDVCRPERLEEQLRFLKANPQICAAGTGVEFIDAAGITTGQDAQNYSPAHLKWELSMRNVIWHPTAVIRREWLEKVGGYDESFAVAQDYDLWSRIIRAGGAIAVMPEVLVRYRRTLGQITSRRAEEQASASCAVIAAHNAWLIGDTVSTDEAECLWNVFGFGRMDSAEVLPRALRIARRARKVCLQGADHATATRIRLEAAQRLLLRARSLTVPYPRMAVRLGLAALSVSRRRQERAEACLILARAWRWMLRRRIGVVATSFR